METYGNILVIVTPLFLFLVLFEKWYGWYKGFETVETLDMISSLSSGVTNSTKDVLGLSVGILSYPWLVEHFNLIQVQSSVLLYLIAFMALDFSGYWVHRLNHTINIFWNNHLVHHSSEAFLFFFEFSLFYYCQQLSLVFPKMSLPWWPRFIYLPSCGTTHAISKPWAGLNM